MRVRFTFVDAETGPAIKCTFVLNTEIQKERPGWDPRKSMRYNIARAAVAHAMYFFGLEGTCKSLNCTAVGEA